MLKIWKTTLSNNRSIIHYSWRDASFNWYCHSKYTSLWKTMESILLISTWRMLECFLETGKNLKSNNRYLQSKCLLIQVITSDWISPEAFLLHCKPFDCKNWRYSLCYISDCSFTAILTVSHCIQWDTVVKFINR